MELECSQILLSVADLARSRRFFIEQLDLPIVEEHPRMFAFRAGHVRFSVFESDHATSDADCCPINIMLRTEDLEKTVQELMARGVVFEAEIEEAPGFMRHIELEDPDGNLLYLAQYVRDPLTPVKVI